MRPLPPPAKTALADIETTPITYDAAGEMIIPDTVWILVANDYERNVTHEWIGHEEIEQGVRWLESCDRVVFHFGRGFDEKVLRHHFKMKKDNRKFLDSLVLCRIFYSNQTEDDKIVAKKFKDSGAKPTRFTFTGSYVGQHSLEAWGLRVGCPKGTYKEDIKAAGKEPFMQFEPILHNYAKQDVVVLRKIWEDKLLPAMSYKGEDVSLAIKIEHQMAVLMDDLKRTGIKFNVNKAAALNAELEKRSAEMVEQLQKDFPPRFEPLKWVFEPLEPNNNTGPGESNMSDDDVDALIRQALEHQFSDAILEEVTSSASKDEETDEDDVLSVLHNKKTDLPHKHTRLIKMYPKNKAYRNYFNLPEGYQREMWGDVFCPEVNRALKDKDGNVIYQAHKYLGEVRYEEKRTKKGEIKEGAMIWPEPDGTGVESNAYVKCHWQKFNPKSRPQLIRRLLEMGWMPDEFTEAGNPVTDDPTLQKIEEKYADINGVKNLAHFLMIEKRIGMISKGEKAWLNLVDPNGYIHPTIRPCAAVTMRATHSDPNVSQVPAVKTAKDGHTILKGEEGKWNWDCRALFTVPDGFTQVGVDLSGIELRCWGHYQQPYDHGALIEQILFEDIHENNRKILGFNDRTTAKRWLFAMLYGGGDEQLGWIIAPTKTVFDQVKLGKESKRRFMSGVRGFDLMKSNLELSVRRRGWLRGIDGRRVPIRKPHAALNTQLQSCGAIISKYWIMDAITNIEGSAKEQLGLQWGYDKDYTLMLYSHDETQSATRKRETNVHERSAAQFQLETAWKAIPDEVKGGNNEIREKFEKTWGAEDFRSLDKALAITYIASAYRAGELMKMRIPVAAEHKTGEHWGNCH